MNLNLGINYPNNKEKNLIKKDIINKNFSKIINLILSNQPIVLSKLNYPNKLVNKINTTKKGYSLKYNNSKNYKTSYIKENGKFFNVEISKLNKDKKKVIESTKNIYDNNKRYKKNKSSFYILNNRKYNDNKFNDIPIINTSFHKKKRIQINKKNLYSISKSKNVNSFSKSQNLSNASFDIKKISERKLSPIEGNKNKKIGINFTIKSSNKNNKFYLIKKRQNISHDLKTKMSLYIQNQKKYSQKDKVNRENIYSDLIKNNISNINKNIVNVSFSYDKLKNIKKLKNNNTFTNITTNISDKENINISSRKNNITTNNSNLHSNSNNVHYFTTNFNSSTNITETNNDLYNENKYTKEKKIIKRKIKLPVHPKSKLGEMPERKKILIRDNKSEVKIPFNKKNKISKVKRDNSYHNFQFFNKNKKIEKIKIHNTSREKKNNSSFIDSYINQNFINSSGPLHYRNKISISKNNLSISSRENNLNNGFNEGIEMNHFKIVTIIQENKRLLRLNDNKK